MYYALTEKGYDRIERGLPDNPTEYFRVLGAVADLEEQHQGTRPFSEYDIRKAVGDTKNRSIFFSLRKLITNGLVEEISPGDDRFNWDKL